MQARILTAALAVIVATACSDATGPDAEMAGDARFASANASPKAADMRTYEVTVENLTGGQPLTPPLAVTHRGAIDVFDVGAPASYGLSQIAENGNLAPMVGVLESSPHVADLVVAVAGDPPPVMPGTSVTFQIEAEGGARFLSFVSMLICTNDGFTGLDSKKLPERVGDRLVFATAAYDAGSEINTEDFADLVPPCPALTGVPSSDPGTGSSDPALAENGVIRHHPGIAGVADLQTGLHGWSDPVARVTVERLD